MTFTWQDGAVNQLTVAGTTISVTLSGAIAAGDVIICTTGAPSFVIGDASDTAGNTWVKIGSTVAFHSIFATVSAVAAAGGTTITVAHSGSSGARFLVADRFTPTVPVIWTGYFSSSTATGTSGNSGTIPVDPGGNLLYGAVACTNSSLTFTAGSSNGVSATSNEQIGNTGGSGFSQFILSTAAGAQSLTWTASGTVNSNNSAVQATFGGVAGTVQPRATVPVPRRRPARARVQFKPVVTTNATGAPPPSGTVQPRATVPVPRRTPGRGQWRQVTGQAFVFVPAPLQQYRTAPRRVPSRGTWRGTAVPGILGTAPAQQYRTAPRRAPARAFVRFIPVATVNAVAGAGRPVLSIDTESRLIRRYRHMLHRHGMDWEPEVSMLAAPVALQVPPGWPGTWPVALTEPEPEPVPSLPSLPPPKWRPVYVRPPKIVRARQVPRDAMMPVWRKG